MISNDKQAIVIGASIAGLVAARVLSDHFGRVTVIERDRLPAGPDSRPGAPQAAHIHVLLMKGQEILERLFPGLEGELAAAGEVRAGRRDSCSSMSASSPITSGSGSNPARSRPRRIASREGLARRRRVPLVEHEVNHLEHIFQPVRQLGRRRHLG